jgi:pilus assembly protein FimV
MIRKKLPADQAMEAHKLTGKPLRWQASALALAAAVAVGAFSSDAQALALGRITVQSALGEPLRADIDIPEITPEEAASLRATVASPEAFRAAGLEYSPAVGNLVITLQQRPGGRMFLRLTSDRSVNEPFIDLILEANWSSGRIVRDYTMLFDPPNLRPASPPAASVAQVPAAPATRPVAPAPAPAPLPPASVAPPSIPARPAPAPAPRPAVAAPAPVQQAAARPAPAPADGRKVTVQAGDTAGKIAAANKPASVSLDQMLVALLRANPDAFIAGNINRVKAGAVLDLPSAEQAGLVEPGEAGRTVVAQSRDFNEFRRKLAEGVPTSQVAAADRQATGKLQAKVEDKKPAAAAPDKLTLSKGAVQAKAAEDKIAKERQAKEAATRVAELNKNIAELSKMGAATSPVPATPSAPAAAAAAAASKPAVAVAAGAVAPAVATVASAPAAVPPVVSASAPAAASVTAPASAAASAPAPIPAVAASAPAPTATPAPAAAAKPPAPKPAPVPEPEPSFVDELLGNPLIPAAVGGLLALVLGFLFYRSRQRKKSTQVDSSFLESRLQPDSFFGASGGQRIDTNEGGPTGSSMVYSPSQLDAAGDVDPVAEADVYLAYGRDLQAEEILKEALRTTPQRVAIHGKLLEIYSKRRDAKAFEMVATDAYNLTRGEGPEWEHICELGQELDPSNSMYRPGGQPTGGTGTVAMAAIPAASGNDFSMATATHVLPTAAAQAAAPSVDLDLDLDFSLGDDEPPGPGTGPDLLATTPMQLEPTVAFTATPPPQSLDMDFGSGTVALPPSGVPDLPPIAAEPVRLSAPDLTLSENELSFSLDGLDMPSAPAPSPAPNAAAPAAEPAPDSGMIEFDMGALSLDLGSSPAPSPAAAPASFDSLPSLADAAETAGSPLSTGFDDSGSDPLATKLALAEEFNAIGDPDGARSLAEEVVAEASGALKVRAQKFLAELA